MNCKAVLENDKLILETGKIKRIYLLNKGNLISELIEDKMTGTIWDQDTEKGFSLGWEGEDIKTDFALPRENSVPVQGIFEIEKITESQYYPEHMIVKVSFMLENVEIMREFKLYPDSPAIACTFYLRGHSDKNWLINEQSSDNSPVESADDVETTGIVAPMLEKIYYPGKHITCNCVQFFDITDLRNNLIKTEKFTPYTRKSEHCENILMGWDVISGNGFFTLKEAPCSDIQITSPGFDFQINNRYFSLFGLGIQSADLQKDEWVRAYGFVTGVASGRHDGIINAIRKYKECKRPFSHKRDSMILLNT